MSPNPGTLPSFPNDFNMADYFLFANLEAGRGDKTAIIFDDQRISYSEAAAKVLRVAERLVGDGLLPEQRVLICMRDCPHFAFTWFGAIKAGGVVAQINPLLPVADYQYYLDYVKPHFVFVDDASAANFQEAAAGTRLCAHGANIINIDRDFDEWIARDRKAAPWPTRKDDPAVWLFTSGTTGHSKAAVHCHFHFAHHTELYAKSFIGMREDDITISGPRLFFGYATGTNLMFPWAVGATTILFREQPSVGHILDLAARHKASVFTSVPTLINKMIEDEAQGDLSSVRFMWSAGEALPQALHEQWDERYGVPIIDGIGSAESFHIYISNHPNDIRPGSIGKLVPGYETRLVDDDGQDVGDGDVGTLWVKGATSALYYQSAYDKSCEHLRGGWIVSGDKFRQDEQGYWYYEGRGDDLIKSGGIYVSPLEVENCLLAHDAVRECCVIGKKDASGLEKPFALIVLHEPGSVGGEDLIAFAKARLARYKAPHGIAFVDTPLPRNDRDKIDRKKLRGAYA